MPVQNGRRPGACDLPNCQQTRKFIFLLSSFRDRVFKKSSANGKITVYLGKRDFVDHITHVDPIGEFLFSFWIILITKTDDEENCGHSRLSVPLCLLLFEWLFVCCINWPQLSQAHVCSNDDTFQVNICSFSDDGTTCVCSEMGKVKNHQ
jgi:hypothetical protein